MSESEHISKLYLFAKDTDATDTIRGFKYQELKTLEIWLFNRVNNIDEKIYCDYEEDIFQRDIKEFKTTFKQLKLYTSRNFSFSSPELTKTINHFFMLFVKGEYLFDEPLFIFETNASYTSTRNGDDPELLNEWVDNQENLNSELLSRCVHKIQVITQEYINKEVEKINEKNSLSSMLMNLKKVYDEIPRETWEHFVKSIRWKFDGISSEEAIERSVQNSLILIKQLPFPISSDDHSLVFDRLRGIVSDKSMAANPEDRVISNDILNHELINLGGKEDKKYIVTYDLWKDVEEIKIFKIGEFYQVIFSAEHCRRKRYLKDHSKVWINLLNKYISITLSLPNYRRKAIYELIWSTLRPSIHHKPDTSLGGLEELAIEYLSDFEKYDKIQDVEDALNLITVIASTQRVGLINIEEDRITIWFDQLDRLISKCKKYALDRNAYCNLLEIEGFLIMNKSTLGIGDQKYTDAFKIFNEIISELDGAPLYSVSQLGKKIDALIELLIKVGAGEKIELMVDYSDKLLPFIKDREGNFSIAKRHTDLAMKFLNSTNPNGLIKALDLFHKAKDLYFDEATYEGFILSLLGISQLYASIGMNLASKYYSLTAIWFCANNDDPKFYKRISDSYSLLFYSEFKQGSWISALSTLEDYFAARIELDPTDFNPDKDELLRKTILESTFIIALTPIISPQLEELISYIKSEMGQLYDNYFHAGVDFTSNMINEIGLKELTSRKVDCPPINDIGRSRIISWKCFGSLWKVEFNNDYISNSIGEEFCALIQIIQSDIALSGIDFHLVRATLRFMVEITDTPKGPQQLPSKDEYRWKVFLPLLNSKDGIDKKEHYSLITTTFQIVLNEISLLKSEVFDERFNELFKQGLGNKAFILNAYQREYRELFPQRKFDEFKRNTFNAVVLEIDFRESSSLGKLKNTSEFYNREDSLNTIKKRYNKLLNPIYLTIKRLNQSKQFNDKISILRKEGWLDWQILLALFNTIGNLKAQNFIHLKNKHYKSDEEYLNDLQIVFTEIMRLDEKETYVEIPLEEIYGQNFEFQITALPLNVLESYNLESKSRFPNSSQIREFLNDRFHFNTDDVVELSPFMTY